MPLLYRELPLAVAIPKTGKIFSNSFRLQALKPSLIPRTTGTSLAGQIGGSRDCCWCVENISTRYLNLIKKNVGWKCNPGDRDELNLFWNHMDCISALKHQQLTVLWLVVWWGNNSCGSILLCTKSTRASAGSKSIPEWWIRSRIQNAGISMNFIRNVNCKIWKEISTGQWSLLSNYENQGRDTERVSKKSVERRNTGYAIDLLAGNSPFTAGTEDFNFCKLIAGSKAPLAFITEIKLNVVPLPPKKLGLMCVHFNTIDESLHANLIG